MPASWASGVPNKKIEVGTTDISNDTLDVVVRRIENGISLATLQANDLEGINYIGNIDVFDILKVSFRYGTGSWTQVFEGVIEKVGPALSSQGQLASATAYGYGRALRNTHCHVNFGSESDNPGLDEPTKIWDDLVANRINKDFDGAATGYALTDTKIKTIASPTITFMPGYYQNNLALVNAICQLYTADQAGSASVHWFVDPSKNLWIDTIAAHTVDTTNWPTYWGGSQANSTLVEGADLQSYNLSKTVQGFANKIVLFSDLRKPAYDYWTEDSGGAALWGNEALTSITDENSADVDPGAPVTPGFIVGSHSVNFDPNGAVTGYGYYPSGASADWDISKMGSEQSIPTVNFYSLHYNLTTATTYVRLSNNDTARKTDYYYATFLDYKTDPDYTWLHHSLPVGPYWQTTDESRDFRWGIIGSPVWTDIDTVEFVIVGAGANGFLLVDDLHFSGKIIREAKNNTSIGLYDEHQKIVRMDVSVDDSLEAADDSGTAAQIAYAELLTSQSISRCGQLTTPLMVDVLPGQLVHVHAGLRSIGSYRVNDDFRIKEVTHRFTADAALTVLDVTDDVKNTFALGSDYSVSRNLSALYRVLHVDPEAKNLKASGLDPLIQRLTVIYNS